MLHEFESTWWWYFENGWLPQLWQPAMRLCRRLCQIHRTNQSASASSPPCSDSPHPSLPASRYHLSYYQISYAFTSYCIYRRPCLIHRTNQSASASSLPCSDSPPASRYHLSYYLISYAFTSYCIYRRPCLIHRTDQSASASSPPVPTPHQHRDITYHTTRSAMRSLHTVSIEGRARFTERISRLRHPHPQFRFRA